MSHSGTRDVNTTSPSIELIGGRLQKRGESRSIYSAGWSSLVARRAHNPEVVGSNPTPATSYHLRHQRLGVSRALSRFHLEAVRGRNAVPNSATEPNCRRPRIFPHDVRVNSERDAWICVSEPLLADLHRNGKMVHQRGIGVTESVKSISPWQLDIQCFQQRPKLTLSQEIRVPRCAIPGSKQQAPLVQAPRLEETAQMLDTLRRQVYGAETVGCLRTTQFPPPRALPYD
jgi:hypothetical protein